MADLLYPENLPCPRLIDASIVDQRQRTDGDGPMLVRAVSAAMVVRESLAFTFTFGQAAEFRDWWRDELVYGGAWFAAKWPTPAGLPPGEYGVRRFITPPVWSEFIAGVGWGMSVQAELLGVGSAPQTDDPAAGLSIGWLEPAIFPWAADPSTASTENAGNFPFWEVQPVTGGLVANVGTGPELVFFLDTWEPVIPGDDPPTVTNSPETHGIFSITFGLVPGDLETNTPNRVRAGIATVRATVEGALIADQYLVIAAAGIEGYYAAVEYFHVYTTP